MSPQQNLLCKLRWSNISYVLIRKPEKWSDSGDIDILVECFDEINKLLIEWGYLEFKSNEYNKKYLKYDPISEFWIHLDVHKKINFGDIQSSKTFIKSIINNLIIDSDGILRLNQIDEFVINFFHFAINKNKFRLSFIESISQINFGELNKKSETYNFLLDPLEKYFNLIIKLRDNQITQYEVIDEIKKKYNHIKEKKNPFLKKIINKILPLRNKKKVIVFLGPDGAGKSTITNIISGLRWPKLRLQYMGPAHPHSMNPILLKILLIFSIMRKRFAKAHPVGFLTRIFWNIVCYIDLNERLYRHFRFFGSNGIVIFDRYACDVFIRKKTWINEILFIKFFFKPDQVFLCVGDAKVIRKRKQELSIDQIEASIKNYKSILEKYKISYDILNTTENDITQNIKFVVNKLIKSDK